VSFSDGKFSDAARAFEDVSTTYPRAPFGRLAGLYRAHALARSGDQAGAATAYTEYLASSPDSEYLRQEALDGLGRAKEASGDRAGALEAYTQAGALPGPYRTDALLGAARLHDASGQGEKAREIYASLLKDVSDPDTKALLTAKLPGKMPATAPAAAPEAAPASP
jgi:TolA-binding protein